MQIRGKLSDRSPADLIEWLHRENKSGALRFWDPQGAVRKDVFFENGKIVSSGTNEPREFLGQFLIAKGRMSEQDFVRVYRTQLETKVLFGKVLVLAGLVSQAEVATTLKEKTEETIWDVFLWRDGVFEFDDAAALAGQKLPIVVEVGPLITEGEKRVIEWGVIRQTLPHTALEVRLGPKAEGADARDARILEEIARGKKLAQLAIELRLSNFLFLRRMHDLVKRGLLEVVGPLEDEDIPAAEISIETYAEPAALPAVPAAIPDMKSMDSGVSETQIFRIGTENLTVAEMRARIPVLKLSNAEMMKMKFSAEEGYLLSRVDGIYDLATVVSLCPFKESLAFQHLAGLAGKGIIALQKA